MENVNNSEIDLDEAVEIAAISQTTEQFDNFSLQALTLDGITYVIEGALNESTTYQLTPAEAKALDLNELAAEWASNCDDELLERLKWGLDSTADIAAKPDHEGCVQIVCEGSYYGYGPIDYLRVDESWESRVFENYAEAQAWIDQDDGETCFLSHNQAGRDDHTIVPA